ncbi:hypothetical protein AY554_11415 [Corynebacterium diphtheriae bv. gravis]|nr:hypothetical protein AY554_11415 [Corynebacterium diphtheriae bv. gravis]
MLIWIQITYRCISMINQYACNPVALRKPVRWTSLELISMFELILEQGDLERLLFERPIYHINTLKLTQRIPRNSNISDKKAGVGL